MSSIEEPGRSGFSALQVSLAPSSAVEATSSRVLLDTSPSSEVWKENYLLRKQVNLKRRKHNLCGKIREKWKWFATQLASSTKASTNARTVCAWLFFMWPSRNHVRMAGGRDPLASHTTLWGRPALRGPSRPRTSTLSGPTAGTTGRQGDMGERDVIWEDKHQFATLFPSLCFPSPPRLTVHVYLNGLLPFRRPGVVGGPAGYKIQLYNQ